MEAKTRYLCVATSDAVLVTIISSSTVGSILIKYVQKHGRIFFNSEKSYGIVINEEENTNFSEGLELA